MSDYKHPSKLVNFALKELAGFDQLCADLGIKDIDADYAAVIVEEAAKFGEEVLAPLNRYGDIKGSHVEEIGVQEPEGFADAYRAYVESGWGSVSAPQAFGGQGLPGVLNTAVMDILNSANMAFALCPILTEGAIEALAHHGSDNLKAVYLEKMITGQWSGTMNLTEADAGTDLAAVKTQAEPDGDNYRINGQKIFITWGDHQMAENIIHLVLARLPDAPPGVDGISLFLVPKFMPDENGVPGEPNDLRCLSVEHKLGINASPTCVMEYGGNGGALGYLVGEPNNGLACMFTMMNSARQVVGLQGASISEVAYQKALSYAKERLQGTRKDGSRFPIIEFPDVRRMLLQMQVLTEATRGFAFMASSEADRARHLRSEKHIGRTGLFTPIVKGWITEVAQEVTSLGIQVHGGMGFIEETGAAQFYRDARILPIYEGTNGVQALDLVGRKILRNRGADAQSLLEDIAAEAQEIAKNAETEAFGKALLNACQSAGEALELLLTNSQEDHDYPGSVSFSFMMLFGWLCGGWAMARSAHRAVARKSGGDTDTAFLDARIQTAQFYFDQLLPRADSCLRAVRAGTGVIMSFPEEQF